jgi:hypothetical protein
MITKAGLDVKTKNYKLILFAPISSNFAGYLSLDNLVFMADHKKSSI